ncbi:uncharacterized protein [Macrobrachium rosenbergii]|uniref:uncharacterized protein isoform X4 n=1 Tax=Macrobrachium rosenbergii TaxID=79674 RepID=UPI0034D3C715
MDVTSPPDGNNTMVPPSILLQDAVTVTPTSSLDEETLRRQKELEEFYSTYDVWTGIRTAITLALFFIFTVTLILYKSKCKPRRKYELYPSLEDMPGRPLDYCDYWCASPVSVKSLPGSVMRINCSRMSSFERDDVSQATAHSCRSEFLRVPGVRLQSTGSSSDGYSAGSSTHDLPSDINSVGLLGVPGLGPRAPVRMQTLSNLHRPAELRGRKKPLQRQKVQDLSTAAIPVMGTLLVPTLGSNLTASCERLAAHSALTSEASLGSSRGSTSLAPTSSVEDEPMCAVFTVPALRRTNSATTPEMKEEAAASAASFKRADSEQNPAVRRADSATDPQRQSSESSSGSEASDSVSFHLMVPELSVDIPSADTSRASTPTLSPMGSPIASPRTSRLSTSRSNSLEPTPSIKRKGSKRGAGGSAKASGRNGKRVLKRQHNVQCPPVSPTFKHDPPVSQSSLPTYMEEEDDDDDDLPPLPPAPPSSPYPCAASPTGGGRQSLQREDSSPSSPTPPNNVMETSC